MEKVSIVSLQSLTNPLTDIDTVKPREYGIYPYKTWRRIWEFIIYFLSMVCLWELPYEWLFNIDRTIWYIIPALVIDIFFFIDVFIVTRTGYFQDGVLVLDKQNVKNSLSKWRIVIYCLSPWPYYLIGWFLNNDVVFRVLVSLKCLRFLRLYDASQRLNDSIAYVSQLTNMFTLFCRFFTVAHFCACIFWYTGYFEVPKRSWIDETDVVTKPKYIQYFHSLYYITTTILTIGYGDLHPYTYPEVCVVILIEACGCIFYNYVVSYLVSLVANPTRISFVTKFHRIYSAFRYRGVSEQSLNELLKYYEYVWEHNRGRADFYETVSKMPEKLQKKLNYFLHHEVFAKVDAFRNFNEESLETIALCLRPRIFTPGDFIIKAGRVSGRIFFVTDGKVKVTDPEGHLIKFFDGSSGCVFGDVSMLSGSEEVASAIAETYVNTFELLKEDFDRIVESNPQFHAMLEKSHLPNYKSTPKISL